MTACTRVLPLLLILACSGSESEDPTKKPTTGTDPTTETTQTTTTTATTTTNTTPPGDLIGNTYAVDIASGNWVEPAGVGALISTLISIDLLLGIDDLLPPDLFMSGALADGLGQNLCIPSIELPVPADFSGDPQYVVQAASLVVDAAGIPVEITDVFISATFSPDLSEMQDLQFEGTIDVGPIDPLVGGNSCLLLAIFGANCMPCASGTQTCIDVVVDTLTATEVPGLTLQTVTLADVAADPNCP